MCVCFDDGFFLEFRIHPLSSAGIKFFSVFMAPFFVVMRRVGANSETGDANVDWTDILCRQEVMRSADVSSVA